MSFMLYRYYGIQLISDITIVKCSDQSRLYNIHTTTFTTQYVKGTYYRVVLSILPLFTSCNRRITMSDLSYVSVQYKDGRVDSVAGCGNRITSLGRIDKFSYRACPASVINIEYIYFDHVGRCEPTVHIRYNALKRLNKLDFQSHQNIDGSMSFTFLSTNKVRIYYSGDIIVNHLSDEAVGDVGSVYLVYKQVLPITSTIIYKIVIVFCHFTLSICFNPHS